MFGYTLNLQKQIQNDDMQKDQTGDISCFPLDQP